MMESSTTVATSVAGINAWLVAAVPVTEVAGALDVWRARWSAAGVGGVVLTVGAIGRTGVAPAAVAAFRTVADAARASGIAVGARATSGVLDPAILDAEPGWAFRDDAGKTVATADGVVPCVTGGFFEKAVPAAIAAAVAQLRPDLLLDTDWSGADGDRICRCAACATAFKARAGRDLPKPDYDDPAYRSWLGWSRAARTTIWNRNSAAGGLVPWVGVMPLERQARSHALQDAILTEGAAPPLRFVESKGPSRTGRFRSLSDDVRFLQQAPHAAPVVVLTSLALRANRRFGLASAPPAEIELALAATIAADARPAVVFGAEAASDRRSSAHLAQTLQSQRRMALLLTDRSPVGGVALVWSQNSADHYGRAQADLLCDAPYRGLVRALTENGVSYRPIASERLAALPADVSVLILPNIAAMRDEEIAGVERFVRAGGTLVATGETSLYDAAGEPRKSYGLAALLGAAIPAGGVPDRLKAITRLTAPSGFERPGSPVGRLRGPATDHSYLRCSPEKALSRYGPHSPGQRNEPGARHPILSGFQNTDMIAFGGILQPIDIAAGRVVPLTFIPPFPNFPIDEVYPRVERTDTAGLVVGTHGKGRVAFMPADIDRRYGVDPIPDHATLLANLLRWAAGAAQPVTIAGRGVVSSTLYRQGSQLVLHLVNLTGADNQAGAIDHVTPVGPLTVSVSLPHDVAGSSAQARVGGGALQHAPNAADGARRMTFVLPLLGNHETVVIA